MKKIKRISKVAKVDYDVEYDILYFKINDKLDYDHSIEVDNFVVDFDEENTLIGVQIMEASGFLKLSKKEVEKVKKWMLEISLDNGRMYLNIEFKVKQGNKTYVRNPIIIESLNEKVFVLLGDLNYNPSGYSLCGNMSLKKYFRAQLAAPKTPVSWFITM